ncbi:MAG: hypothetical protein HFI74_05475 [Lachnospiraceae bacterium]|jgi:hypothetical protein|nr:hypothetical protein [Lachnospiraceae bacterium]
MKTEEKIICNRCGKVVLETEGIPREEFLHVEKEWGYFSNKDGIRQEFDLCETCYDAWVREFEIPAKSQEIVELI